MKLLHSNCSSLVFGFLDFTKTFSHTVNRPENMICLCKFISVSVWQSWDKPCRITQPPFFLITLLCCLSSAADSWKQEAFSIRTSSPSELPSLPHALLLCVCKLFGNLSNFTLVKFPCKRQHFRKKPSGWVNVISNCVCVPGCVSVGDGSMQISEVSTIRGRFEFLEHLLRALGTTNAAARNTHSRCCLHSCDQLFAIVRDLRPPQT